MTISLVIWGKTEVLSKYWAGLTICCALFRKHPYTLRSYSLFSFSATFRSFLLAAEFNTVTYGHWERNK